MSLVAVPSCTYRHLCAAVSSVDVSEYCIPQVDIPLVEANEYMFQRVHTGCSWFTGHTRLQVISVTQRRLLLYCFHTSPSAIASRMFVAQAVSRSCRSPGGIFSCQSSARTGISDLPPPPPGHIPPSIDIIPPVPIFNNLSPALCNFGTLTLQRGVTGTARIQ